MTDLEQALEYYRHEADALGARLLRAQEELARTRREARRSRLLAQVVQRLHEVAQGVGAALSSAAGLADTLLALLVETLRVDCAALLVPDEHPHAYRVEHGLGLTAGLPISRQAADGGAGLDSSLWVEISASARVLLLANRHRPGGGGVSLDGDDRLVAEAALTTYLTLRDRQQVRERLELALEGAEVGLYEVDLPAHRIRLDERHLRLRGLGPPDLAMNLRDWEEVLHPDDRLPVFTTLLGGRPRSGDRFELEYRLRHSSGAWIWVLDRGKHFDRDLLGNPRRVAGTCVDISARKQTEESIFRLAYYDPLTDLPNRRLFLDRLHQAQASGERHGRYGAVLFLDLDNFKHVNDARGHEAGDQLLREVAARLTGGLRAEDTVARFGGDEFVMLLGDLSTTAVDAVAYARTVAEKVLQLIGAPFWLAAGELSIGGSIGVSLFRGEHSGQEVIKEADTALYQAKSAGRGGVRFFEAAMQVAAESRFELENELRRAAEAQQLHLYLQAQVDAAGRLVGAEALLRWRHPSRGQISPASFIPLAEETGLIIPVGRWVLGEVCRILALLQREGSTLRLAVNVSPRQFRQTDFVAEVRGLLAAAGADPAGLTLEITEGVVIGDLEGTIARMTELKAVGVQLSLDDFGTGYSSLSYLKRLPIDELKIDRSFVQDAPQDSNDAVLVEAILAVTRHMRLKVVAEGVENSDQLQFLAARGCPLYQGFLFGRPEPAQAFLHTWGLARHPDAA
jgi:diguanylate cyclase (GGDEF)-like protein/PAS domain S-box-containing protein